MGSEYKYDFFISHASEQKETVVYPLKKLLEAHDSSIKVWVDKEQITIGDNIVGTISEGLRLSKFVIVILSEEFFKKEWTKAELDATVYSQLSKGIKRVLPVRHQLSQDELNTRHLLMAPYASASTDEGIDQLFREIIRATIPARNSEPEPATFHNYDINKNIHSIPGKITFIPAIHSTDVIGRETDLQNLEQQLEKSGKVVLLNGMGGIGKTTLAKEYVNQYGSRYKHLVWIDCLQNFKNAVAFNQQLTQNIGLEFSQQDNEEARYVGIISRLSLLEGSNLMIVDNANETINDESHRLPDNRHWEILVTSRNELPAFKKMKLDVLQQDAAIKLFKELYGNPVNDDAGLKALLERVGWHTLTIELLAKTARNRHISIDELAKRFSEKGLRFSETKVTTTYEKVKTPDSLLKIMELVFDTAALPEGEFHLLLQFALMPSVDIDFNKLTDLLGVKEEGKDIFSDWLNKLAASGWLINNEDNFKCHQVIQEVVRIKKGKIELADCENLAVSIGSKLYLDHTKDNPVDKFQWVEWGEILLHYIQDDGEAIARLQSHLGSRYRDLGNFEKAHELLETVLKSSIRNFGEHHINVARNQSNLALVYQDLGNFKKARELLEAALESAIRNLGEDHPNVATSQSNLAIVYRCLGNPEKAQELLEAALKFYIKNFGEDHPSVARSQSNLALVYQDLGDFEKARELLEAALKSDIRKFGEDHPFVAIRQSNLALVYKALGDFEQAQKLLEAALKSDIRNLGEDHPTVAISQSNLAMVYRDIGKFKRARELMEMALKSDLRNFGEGNPAVATSQSNLALVYQDLGNFEKAQELMEAALKSGIINFGEDHPTVAITQLNLATVYLQLNERARAKELFESAYQISLNRLGEAHPQTVNVREWLDNNF